MKRWNPLHDRVAVFVVLTMLVFCLVGCVGEESDFVNRVTEPQAPQEEDPVVLEPDTVPVVPPPPARVPPQPQHMGATGTITHQSQGVSVSIRLEPDRLYCVDLHRTGGHEGSNCFWPVLYAWDNDTHRSVAWSERNRVVHLHRPIIQWGEEGPVSYWVPTDQEDAVVFVIADHRSVPARCYPYRYTLTVEEGEGTCE